LVPFRISCPYYSGGSPKPNNDQSRTPAIEFDDDNEFEYDFLDLNICMMRR
jgi:hypothetical protein